MKMINCVALATTFGLLAATTGFAQTTDGAERPDAVTDVRPDERPEHRDRGRGRCASFGVYDAEMRARYGRGGDPAQVRFRAGFEISAEGPLVEGDILSVRLAGVEIGDLMLTQNDAGTLSGSIEIHEEIDNEDDIRTLQDIPVRRGTSVVIGPLGCALHR